MGLPGQGWDGDRTLPIPLPVAYRPHRPVPSWPGTQCANLRLMPVDSKLEFRFGVDPIWASSDPESPCLQSP